MLAVLAVVWPAIFHWRAGKMIRNIFREGKNLAILGPRRLTLTPQYLMHASPVVQTVTRWIGIERIVVDPNAIYILQSSTSAFIVPRRAFADEAQFRQFADKATEFHARSLA